MSAEGVGYDGRKKKVERKYKRVKTKTVDKGLRQ